MGWKKFCVGVGWMSRRVGREAIDTIKQNVLIGQATEDILLLAEFEEK